MTELVMQPRKIAITGGTGFVGSHLIPQLTKSGHHVYALARNPDKLKPVIETIESENSPKSLLTVIKGDLNNQESLNQLVRNADSVIHLAGSVGERTIDDYYIHNEIGSKNLSQAVINENKNRLSHSKNAEFISDFVYLSSLAAGGPSLVVDQPRHETMPDAPVSHYGRSKLAAEKAIRNILDSERLNAKDPNDAIESTESHSKVRTIFIRPPAIYGPRDVGVFEFFKTVKSGIHPKLPMSNRTLDDKYYSMVHVDDVCKLITLSLNSLSAKGIYYVSDGHTYSFSTIIEKLSLLMNRKVIKVPVPLFAVRMAAIFEEMNSKRTNRYPKLNKDKIHEVIADLWICTNERARLELGFKPDVTLDHGFRETYQWYKKNHWL